jgi:hypothetical protein
MYYPNHCEVEERKSDGLPFDFGYLVGILAKVDRAGEEGHDQLFEDEDSGWGYDDQKNQLPRF